MEIGSSIKNISVKATHSARTVPSKQGGLPLDWELSMNDGKSTAYGVLLAIMMKLR
jgi:hypothetical protein